VFSLAPECLDVIGYMAGQQRIYVSLDLGGEPNPMTISNASFIQSDLVYLSHLRRSSSTDVGRTQVVDVR
jgi:hypothetical protein